MSNNRTIIKDNHKKYYDLSAMYDELCKQGYSEKEAVDIVNENHSKELAEKEVYAQIFEDDNE